MDRKKNSIYLPIFACRKADRNSFNQISQPSEPDRANSREFSGNRNQE
jgi:hypothetical protein